MPPLVSIIVTTFNRASILPVTLDSVFGQTYPNLEVIVVDDGSTDDTGSVLANFGGRLRYERQPNQGVSQARRRGLRIAHGELINFLDDDDLMESHKIERQLAELEAHPEAGVVHCGFHYIDQAGHWIENAGRLPRGDVRRDLAWGCFPWVGGPLIRSQVLRSEIRLDEHHDWFSDWGMWWRIALAGYTFACVDEPLGSYRIVPGSMTDTKIADAERAVFHILDGVFADPRLPQDIQAEREHVYADWHVWIACRYSVGGYFEDYQRSLTAAFQQWPELRDDPQPLLNRLFLDTINPRVQIHDARRTLCSHFDHLPEIAAPLLAYRDILLSQVMTALAVRSYGRRQVAEARQQLCEAIDLDPKMTSKPGAFARAVYEYACTMPADMYPLIDLIFHNLPNQGMRLRAALGRVYGEIHAARAFEQYLSGSSRAAPGSVISAFWSDPHRMQNRGLWAILWRSLPALLEKKPSPHSFRS